MVQHNSQYFIDALQKLDWSHGYSGNQLMNLFFDFPVGWFYRVPKNCVFTRWEDFWQYVTPISASTVGPQDHERCSEEFLKEANQRDATQWGK